MGMIGFWTIRISRNNRSLVCILGICYVRAAARFGPVNCQNIAFLVASFLITAFSAIKLWVLNLPSRLNRRRGFDIHLELGYLQLNLESVLFASFGEHIFVSLRPFAGKGNFMTLCGKYYA
jgi:hypothetical protein